MNNLYNRLDELETEDECLEFLVNRYRKLSDEEVLNIYKKYLKHMQCGLGMAQSLPTNSTYNGKIFEI